ncbi:hypothetical protein A0128_02735 [Leptospira tipperaryensis]|uniref:Uncharacterized protein n=1 Tax=Leptospira tipperaryensis TaxID=2564040 RepID=A0A1D7UTL1_9LEPT|nr:hypothetical protein A0128_02735 [Leptospira tipperaryensis]
MSLRSPFPYFTIKIYSKFRIFDKCFDLIFRDSYFLLLSPDVEFRSEIVLGVCIFYLCRFKKEFFVSGI